MGKLFICHAPEDRRFAEKMYDDLKDKKLRPWMAEKDILPGQDRNITIKKAIRESSHFILLISKYSVDKRGKFQAEIRYALEIVHELPEDQIFIIPIRLDDTYPTFEELKDIQAIGHKPYSDCINNILKSINMKSTLSSKESCKSPDSIADDASFLRSLSHEELCHLVIMPLLADMGCDGIRPVAGLSDVDIDIFLNFTCLVSKNVLYCI